METPKKKYLSTRITREFEYEIDIEDVLEFVDECNPEERAQIYKEVLIAKVENLDVEIINMLDKIKTLDMQIILRDFLKQLTNTIG